MWRGNQKRSLQGYRQCDQKHDGPIYPSSLNKFSLDHDLPGNSAVGQGTGGIKAVGRTPQFFRNGGRVGACSMDESVMGMVVERVCVQVPDIWKGVMGEMCSKLLPVWA